MSLRIRTAVLTLAFSLTTPVLAATANDTTSSSCNGGDNTYAARCATDTLKQWAREHYDYHAAEEEKHTEWHSLHDPLGVTPENLKAHRDYHEMMKRIHNAFHEKMKREQQAFAQISKGKQLPTTDQPSTARPGGTKKRFERGMKICSKYKSEQEIRFCMRPYVRLLDVFGRSGK